MKRVSLIMMLGALLVFQPVLQAHSLSNIDGQMEHHDQQQTTHDCCEEIQAKSDCCADVLCNGDCGMPGCAAGASVTVILGRLADCSFSDTGCISTVSNASGTSYVPAQDLRPPIKHL
jgi:hypothetical protein